MKYNAYILAWCGIIDQVSEILKHGLALPY